MRVGRPTAFIDHAEGCDGTEYSACRPLWTRDSAYVVVYMEWCGECGAADWEEV